MRNFIKITSITVISTIVVLFILGKMGVAYINMPLLDKGLEKGKGVMKIDTLSQLLELEYPGLGDTMDFAYTLFGDVAFESEKQIDFYILDDQQKIYVNYNPDTNLISSMRLYVKGDITKIRSLGEKMLPSNHSYFDENYFTTEEINEIGRYTKTNYVHEYYYELPETDQYGLISIYNSTNDLFGKDDSTSSNEYRLDISFVSGEKTMTADTNFYQEGTDSYQVTETDRGWETTNAGVIESYTESTVSFEELVDAVIYGGDLTRIENYLIGYSNIDDLSRLLSQVAYLSTDRNNFGYNEIAILLLDSGADPNFRDFQGYTSLSKAVFQFNVPLVRILLEAGANKNFENPSGKSILEEVYANGVPELIEVFEAY